MYDILGYGTLRYENMTLGYEYEMGYDYIKVWVIEYEMLCFRV